MAWANIDAKRLYQNKWKKEKLAKQKTAALGESGTNSSNGDSAANNGLDAFGFPVGTHDAQGRKLGQLDDLYAERDKLNAELTSLQERRDALNKARYAVPMLGGSETLEQEIDTKARFIAIKKLTAENDKKIKDTEAEIEQRNIMIERMEAEVKTIRANIADYSEGGRVYKDKMAYSEVLLRDEEQKKRTAEATLAGKSVEHYSEAEHQLRCANSNIAKHSNVKEWLGAKRLEYEGTLRVYIR
jgi:hypothetical protein